MANEKIASQVPFRMGFADSTTGGVPGSPVTHSFSPANANLSFAQSRSDSGEIYQHRGVSQTAISDRSAALSFRYGLRSPVTDTLSQKLLRSLLFCTPTAIDLSGTTFAVSGQQITDTANGFTDILVGHVIRIKNTTVTGSGIVEVTAKASDGDITVSGALPAVTLGDSVTIQADIYRDAAVCLPLMYEEGRGGSNDFRRALGLYPAEATFTMDKTQIMVDWSFKGTTLEIDQAEIVAPTADPDAPIWGMADGQEDFNKTLKFPELTLKLTNNLGVVPNCKQLNVEGYTPGTIAPMVSGRAIYAQAGVFAEAFNDTRTEFKFSIRRPTGEAIHFYFANMCYESADGSVPGPAELLTEEFSLKSEGQPGAQPFRVQISYMEA